MAANEKTRRGRDYEHEERAWDRRFEIDVAAGKLESFGEEALLEVLGGPLQCRLPSEEVSAFRARDDRAELCIGGSVAPDLKAVILVRGDLSVLAVPLDAFEPVGDGTKPDFEDFEIADHGRTIRFGAYEAAFDAVLHEHDPAFRRRLKKAREERDQTLGASLRRLRKQRGLRLDDFGTMAKTVARIERGEVKRPHRTTLDEIARVLGVETARLREY